jgi:transposase InsO family protein
LLNNKEVNGINQVWVTDITYFTVSSKPFYIIIIMDIYSRKIIGYQVFENMFAENNISVLNPNSDNF